jgi:WhiB family redox-sensing transcriptional regulator
MLKSVEILSLDRKAAMEPDEIHEPETALSSDWRDRAGCRGRMELFFARKAERPQARARREAKASRLCDVCPVHAECLDFSRENHEYGFWAGESEEDRHLAGFTLTAPIGVRVKLRKSATPIAS